MEVCQIKASNQKPVGFTFCMLPTAMLSFATYPLHNMEILPLIANGLICPDFSIHHFFRFPLPGIIDLYRIPASSNLHLKLTRECNTQS